MRAATPTGRRRWVTFLALLVGVLAFPGLSRADSMVMAGWDLFQTPPGGTSVFIGGLGSVPLVGRPIGPFNFGGTIGIVDVGMTDTIVRRMADATAANPTIPIEIVALSLMSAAPVTVVLPGGISVTGFLFITHFGPQLPGSLTISGLTTEGTPHGDFISTLPVIFRATVGDPTGVTLLDLGTGLDILSGTGVPWGHGAPANALLFPGINFMLNGINTSRDFFPIGAFTERGQFTVHQVQTTTITVPASAPVPTLSLLGLLLAELTWLGKRHLPGGSRTG